jgi:salicylate hydroxylase
VRRPPVPPPRAARTDARAVNQSLLVYSEIRKARAETVVASATKTKGSLHLPDGPAQLARDAKIARASRGECANPDL